MFCAKIGWNWPSGSAEEDENWKKYIYKPLDGRQIIREANMSFQFRWAKKVLKNDKSVIKHVYVCAEHVDLYAYACS